MIEMSSAALFLPDKKKQTELNQPLPARGLIDQALIGSAQKHILPRMQHCLEAEEQRQEMAQTQPCLTSRAHRCSEQGTVAGSFMFRLYSQTHPGGQG